jgi:hypothetical protein
MPLQILVTVSPQPTQAATKRIQDLIPWLADQVKQSEPWVSSYQAYRTPALGGSGGAGSGEGGEEVVDFLIYFMYVPFSCQPQPSFPFP